MNTEEYISIDIFCQHHGIGSTFINTMSEYGLLEIIFEDERQYIAATHLGEAEKLVRLHQELDLNNEAIDVVIHLLKRISNQEDQIRLLRSRLAFYESEI